MYCIIATVVALLYVFWDVHYFLRTAFTIGLGRLFQKKCGVRDTTTIYGKFPNNIFNDYGNFGRNLFCMIYRRGILK